MLKSQCFTLLSLHLTPHAFQSLSVLLFQYPTVLLHSFHFFCLPLPPLLLNCFLYLNRNMGASNAIVLKVIAYIRQQIISTFSLASACSSSSRLFASCFCCSRESLSFFVSSSFSCQKGEEYFTLRYYNSGSNMFKQTHWPELNFLRTLCVAWGTEFVLSPHQFAYCLKIQQPEGLLHH